jgi:ribose transport system permease protein
VKKVLGIFLLLVVVCILTTALNPKFLAAYNVQNTVRWTALFSIISIGAAFVIMSGGIDLSIGSTVGLCGTLLAWLLTVKGFGVATSLFVVMLVSLAIGLSHGLLITKLKLPPFVVTLCGLLLYRGAARYLTGDQTLGFGTAFDSLRALSIGHPFSLPYPERPIEIPMPLIIMVVLALLAGLLLNFTIYGRYLLALGRNEQAARFSGINTDRMTIMAYLICSGLGGLGGVLFALDVNSIQPSGLGEFYELYAIAAAVLGGCSLRGGEGTILGVIIGATLLRVLNNAINILGIPTQLDFAVIGVVILGGVITDEIVKRVVVRRRAAREG